MMWYWGSGMHWWGWLIEVVLTIIFWSMIIWAIWYFVSGATDRSSEEARRAAAPKVHSDDALHILEARLARGEIDVEEFEHRRDALRGTAVPSHVGDGVRPSEADRTPSGSPRTVSSARN